MNDVERFFCDKSLVIAYLSQPDKIEGTKISRFRLATDEFPPSAREEIYVKSSKGSSYQGCVTRHIDPKLATELIGTGLLVSDGEKRFKIRQTKNA